MNEIRVRYAPSPTGQLHIGGARTALINYLFAKHYNGKFIFRTEDTDLKRNINDGEFSQINDLKWLGIICDESPVIGGNYGPYRQSERLKLYQKYAQKLLEEKKAYYCFCTLAELKFKREQQISIGQTSPHYSQKCLNLNAKEVAQQLLSGIKPTIRIHVPKTENFTWNDLVRGEISVNGAEIGDWVILKNNQIPTYNFAVVIDDYFMDITHIFRGEEHISNTPKQIHLYDVFGWKKPQFGHITLILNENRKKLSKRDETIIQFIVQYKNMGYLPQAIFNFLTLLGWSPVGEKEIFSKKELIKIFDEKRLSKLA